MCAVQCYHGIPSACWSSNAAATIIAGMINIHWSILISFSFSSNPRFFKPYGILPILVNYNRVLCLPVEAKLKEITWCVSFKIRRVKRRSWLCLRVPRWQIWISTVLQGGQLQCEATTLESIARFSYRSRSWWGLLQKTRSTLQTRPLALCASR